MKTCNVCHQSKPLSDFYPKRGSRDGYGYTCKACSRARSKRWNQENREQHQANKRRYWLVNADEINAKRREFRLTEEGRAARAADRRRYYAANREKDLAASKAWRESDAGRAWYAAYRAENRDRTRLRHVIRTYNITMAQYLEMLETQDGLCAICGVAPDEWAVDHDHACCAGHKSCGKCIRGLLCQPCNRGLGPFGDDPKRLRSAADYLERYATRPPLV